MAYLFRPVEQDDNQIRINFPTRYQQMVQVLGIVDYSNTNLLHVRNALGGRFNVQKPRLSYNIFRIVIGDFVLVNSPVGTYGGEIIQVYSHIEVQCLQLYGFFNNSRYDLQQYIQSRDNYFQYPNLLEYRV